MTTPIVTLIAPELPLAHRANTDAPGHWAARLTALNALRDARVAAGEPAALAADYAIAFLDAELEAEAAQRAAQVAAPALPTVRRASGGAFLVKSRTRNLVHVVSADGQTCSCEARPGTCWHLRAVAEQQPAPLAFDAGRSRAARAA